MDTWLDWMLTHKLDSSIVGIAALFFGRMFWPQIKAGWAKVSGGKVTTTTTVIAAEDHRPDLIDSLCPIMDHCVAIGNKDGIAACKLLAALVIETPPAPPETTAPPAAA